MRFLKKPPRKPLEDALFFTAAALQILTRLERDACYRPDDFDLELLQKIAKQSDDLRLQVIRTEIKMQRLSDPPG